MSTLLFRRVALAEAISYLLLLVATAVKYGAGNEAGVKVLGPVHGMIVLVYLLGVILVRESQRWDLWTTLGSMVAAAIPFGGFLVERRVAEPAAPAEPAEAAPGSPG